MHIGRVALFSFAAIAGVLPLHAAARLSLGYGMQLNTMLHTVMAENAKKQILNTGAVSLLGQSAGTGYSSLWSGAFADDLAPYALLSLPEIRVTSDWRAGANTWGVFTSFSGFLPQTSLYYYGGYRLTEERTCAVIDYTNCPLAALGFVSAAGKGDYDIEVRTAARLYSFSGGVTWGRGMGEVWGGEFSFVTEAGLNVQSASYTSQFAALRCSGGSAPPCALSAQVRSVQGELASQALLAFGPYLGAVLRYERPQNRWFAELGISAVFLYARFTHTGYTNFTAGGTVAFAQTSAALQIAAVQEVFAVLPALSARAGIRL